MSTPITPEEEKNGWTQEKLDAYRRQRNTSQAVAILGPKRIPRPTVQNHRYNPLRWRK